MRAEPNVKTPSAEPSPVSPVLEVRDLRVEFHTPLGVVHAVNGVDLGVNRGETLGILGESGSGKSVTAEAIMGLVKSPPGFVTDGQILFQGQDLSTLSLTERRRIRGRSVAMVFQDAMTSLDPGMTVGRQIGEMFRVHEGLSRRASRERAIELMERVGIPSAKTRVDDYPHQFSGGMSQRIMIASAISLDPEVLIADEPTTALDVTVQAQIIELLLEIQAEHGMALILITHDLGVIAEVAKSVAVMYAGRVVESGSMREVFRRPAHPYTVGLMRATPHVSRKGDRLVTIGGSPPVLSHIPEGCEFAPRCARAEERCHDERPPAYRVSEKRSSACHFYREVLDGVE